MPTRSVNLTERYDAFVEQEIREGRFQDASEVFQAGLYLLERQRREDESKLALLRKLADEGFREFDQGLGIEFDSEEELSEFIRDIGKRAAAKGKQRQGA